MIKTNDFEKQGYDLAHYAFSKDALKPTVYYDDTLDYTLDYDNETLNNLIVVEEQY